MPLKKSSSSKAMSANVRALRREGIPQKQAVAIAMRTKRDAQLRGRSSGLVEKVAWGVFPWTPNNSPSLGEPKPDPENHGWVVREANRETGRGTHWPYTRVAAVKIFHLRHAADRLSTELTFGAPKKGRSFGTHVLALAAGYGLARAVDHPDAVKGAARRVRQEGQKLHQTAKESYAAARGHASGRAGGSLMREEVGLYETAGGDLGLQIWRSTGGFGGTSYSYTGKWGAGSGASLERMSELLREQLQRRRGVKIVKDFFASHGRSTGHTRESKPVILIEYGVLQVDAGWHPVIWENGRDLYHWTPKALDRGEALKHAQREAEHRAKKYVGDWDVRIQPAPEGAKLRSRRKPI